MEVNSGDQYAIENLNQSFLSQAIESLQDQIEARSSRLVASFSKIKSDSSDVSKNSRSDKVCWRSPTNLTTEIWETLENMSKKINDVIV